VRQYHAEPVPQRDLLLLPHGYVCAGHRLAIIVGTNHAPSDDPVQCRSTDRCPHTTADRIIDPWSHQGAHAIADRITDAQSNAAAHPSPHEDAEPTAQPATDWPSNADAHPRTRNPIARVASHCRPDQISRGKLWRRWDGC